MARHTKQNGYWAIISPRTEEEKHYCPDCHRIVYDEDEEVEMVFIDGQCVGTRQL